MSKSHLNKFVAAFAFVFALLFAVPAFAIDKPTSEKNVAKKHSVERTYLGPEFVLEAALVVKLAYARADSVSTVDLLNAALWGISEELENNKIKYVPAPLDEDMNPIVAGIQFYVQYNRACQLANEGGGVGENDLAFAGVDAMLKSLNSSHTRFIHPDIMQQMKPGEDGDVPVVGIGVMLGQLKVGDETLTYVEWVLEGGAASKAGMKRFDKILAVDGNDVPVDLMAASVMIRGEKGTKVTLTIERGKEKMDVELTRDEVPSASADCELMDVNGKRVAYVHIYQFDGNAVEKAIKYLKKNNRVDGVILDLRGNPGGELQAVNALLDALLPESTIGYYTKRSGEFTEYATSGGQVCVAPMVVLVNGGSGSGAEITASALKENNRADVVGEKSAGAVEAAVVLPLLPTDAGMMVAIMEVLSANGTQLEGVGVIPDVMVPLTNEDIASGSGDPQLDKAIHVLPLGIKEGENK